MVDHKDAEELLDMLLMTYSSNHEYAEVDPDDFKYLDLKYYERTWEKLRDEGFRFLGDIEDVTLSQVHPRMRSFIRCLVSGDGSVMAGIYHVRPRGWWRVLVWFGLLKQTRVLDLETEFTDGCFVCTSNAEQAAMMTLPDELMPEFYGDITEPAELLEIHKRWVGEYLSQTDGVGCVIVRSLRDGLASQDRMTALKAAHRDEIKGGLLPEEMDRIAEGKLEVGRDALAKMQEAEDGKEIE